MSILTMTPGAEWYQPRDILDDDDDEPCPPELLTDGWWSACAEMDGED